MYETFDATDQKILTELQRDSGQSMDALSEKVGLGRNAVWRRVKALEDQGVIKSRVALLDANKLGLHLTVFIQIRTNRHDPEWLTKFARATREMPEILGAYRMTGDLDYLVRAKCADMAAYDQMYQRLIRKVDMSDVAASFVMEELKETTALPV